MGHSAMSSAVIASGLISFQNSDFPRMVLILLLTAIAIITYKIYLIYKK